MAQTLKETLKKVPPLVSAVRAARRWRRQAELWNLRQERTYTAQIAAYVESHSSRKLQIGSGPHFLPGWLNTDYEPVSGEFVFMDATRRFPLPERAFEHVFSEHMIEHITYEQGQVMLGESFRCLKPGGKIRIATPNLKNIVELYAAAKTDRQKRYIDWAMSLFYPHVASKHEGFVINNFVRNWGHLFVYDPATLRFALEQAGFTAVRECPTGVSEDNVFQNLECHGKLIGEENNLVETMVLEATRPL